MKPEILKLASNMSFTLGTALTRLVDAAEATPKKKAALLEDVKCLITEEIKQCSNGAEPKARKPRKKKEASGEGSTTKAKKTSSANGKAAPKKKPKAKPELEDNDDLDLGDIDDLDDEFGDLEA